MPRLRFQHYNQDRKYIYAAEISNAVTVIEATQLIHCSETYVYYLIFHDRIYAEKSGGSWRISMSSILDFKKTEYGGETLA